MSKGTVLFIDDDSFLRKVYQAELHDKGFEVALAVDGEDGMQKVHELKPDCIILDLIMPKKNGFEVLTDLQRSDEFKDIPVIILSNLAQSDDQKRALDLGAVEYLVKDNTTLDIIAEKIVYHIQTAKKRPPTQASGEKRIVQPPASPKPEAATPRPKNVEPGQAGSPASSQARSGHNFCSECGEKLAKGAKFCPSCGAKQ